MTGMKKGPLISQHQIDLQKVPIYNLGFICSDGKITVKKKYPLGYNLRIH